MDEPLTPEPAASDPVATGGPHYRAAFEGAQSAITSLLALGALLSGAGFIIVHSFLWSYSEIQSNQVESSTYIGAGIGFVMCALMSLVAIALLGSGVDALFRRMPGFRAPKSNRARLGWAFLALVILWAITYALGSVLAEFASMTATVTLFLIILDRFPRVAPQASQADMIAFIRRSAPRVVIILLYVLVVGYQYGASIYGLIPRAFGGGRPIVIRIALRSVEDAIRPNLGLRADGMSEPVCLLAELASGLIVYDPVRKRTTALQLSNTVGIAYMDTDEQVSCDPLPDRL